ncbi:shufflon system plasmid conjugative transfer pilus tip adhesin PilV, partial [Paramuribaculum intestinale]|uniref:shufflon system plasmid conjugative transfer pilus tip adhesin PilV n=1 Tax=Paramuribaculum intestinale TaxID=2094151 RepID=UPI00272D8F71
ERRARRSGASVVAAGSGSSYNEVYGDIAGKLDRELFDSMFERVSEGVDVEGVERWHILAKSHLVSVGDVTAYGNGGPGGGGSTGGGVTELRCLDDVILTNPKAGQGLKYDGQHWVNGTIDAGLDEAALAAYLQTNRYAKLSDIPSLADYATRSWVEGKSYATQSWVEDKGYATETWVIAQRYLTEHQDISHLLTRAEFEAMFERVDTDCGGWYILAKSHLASVGDVTAYGTGGPGSTLGGIGDVQLGSLAAGDVLKWDGQHWVNGPAPAGGIDESVLANYVTLDTEQEIRGHKRFTHNDTAFSHRITINGSFENDIHHHPQVMWHVSNRRWTKAVMDTWGNIHLLEGSAGTFDGAHQGLIASKFAKYDGTASQVLMADGSVQTLWKAADVTTATSDEGMITPLGLNQWTSANFYKKTDADARFVNVTGDTMTGPLRIAHSATNCVLYTQYNTAGAYSNVIWANVDEPRVIFGSPNWLTVELETANSATAAYRRTNGVQYKIWDSGNHGSGSGLHADLLDGLHGHGYVGYRGTISSLAALPATAGMYNIATVGWSGGAVVFHCGGSNSGLAFYRPGGSNSMPQILCALDGTNNWDNFGSIVTSRFGNAPSATKLQMARTLRTISYNGYRASDGVSFDGTGDVTLKLPNSICASDWFRSYGSSGWYNQDYGGGIYMSDATWIRIYNNKSFYAGTGEIRSDALFNRMGQYGTMWNNGAGAYNVAIYNNANQTPLLHAYRDNAGSEATGANRLFAMELLNNGAMLRFGFGGAEKFEFHNSGFFVTWGSIRSFGDILASGDVTAYSDARLKSDVQ